MGKEVAEPERKEEKGTTGQIKKATRKSGPIQVGITQQNAT
jgi:hypothetical protein